jgi:hypothetical protein
MANYLQFIILFPKQLPEGSASETHNSQEEHHLRQNLESIVTFRREFECDANSANSFCGVDFSAIPPEDVKGEIPSRPK